MAKRSRSTEEYISGIRRGDRVVLGQAITLVESARAEHQAQARDIIAGLLREPGDQPAGIRIGITGAPGVGKSTLIEVLGMHLIRQSKRVAVLAIDPTSSLSKGSILGDKTRMEHLSAQEAAFIRPSPSGDSLGGVARKTRETIVLVEAAGYDTVLIETVGVGQSEIAVHSMTDVFLLLLLPGAGDELQGIKRGIVEMADLIAVNKADGDRMKSASQARAHYTNALHLLPARPDGWSPPVLACSAAENRGVTDLWDNIETFWHQVTANGFFAEKRRQQARYWLREALQSGLETLFYQHPAVREQLRLLEPQVCSGTVSPFAAAEAVLQQWLQRDT